MTNAMTNATNPATNAAMNAGTARFCVLLVAKAPVPGLAKTRLTPPATPMQAAEIAAAALLDTLHAVLATPDAVPVVAMTGCLDEAARGSELRARLAEVAVFQQRGVDFADRLANAHADAGAHCPGLPIVQIGMDTPQVTPALLIDTADTLVSTNADAVLGPAEDGGWWVLGLRNPALAGLLREVPMSTPDTFAYTRLAFTDSGFTVDTTAELSDVDTMADALRVAAMTPGGRFAAAVDAVAVNVVAVNPLAGHSVAGSAAVVAGGGRC